MYMPRPPTLPQIPYPHRSVKKKPQQPGANRIYIGASRTLAVWTWILPTDCLPGANRWAVYYTYS